MTHQPIIEVRNIGKKYDISHDRGRYVALRDVIANIFKSPFSFLKTKAKQAAGLEKKEEFWALKAIDFTVNKGDVIGIIGRNGAGKSTLLKVLSQITPPTTGEITIRGRVGSLLEVGTGFHPELTGRENIFLNGAILGMKKKEIAAKFDQIVEFAGIEKFLDTPVKYYSSGMYVRLAFSVAAHMEPDVLIIDEVLAVGDAEFQKKCLGKMDEITKKEGRTILFVSHNMEAIAQLCPKTIFLKNGMIQSMGPTEKVLAEYSNDFLSRREGAIALKEKTDAEATFSKISLLDEKGSVTTETEFSKDFSVVLDMKVIKELHNADISLSLTNARGIDVVFSSLSDAVDGKLKDFAPGTYSFKTTYKGGFLMPGNYYARISIHYPGSKNIDTREDVLGFKISEPGGKRAVNYGMGSVSIPATWTQKNG